MLVVRLIGLRRLRVEHAPHIQLQAQGSLALLGALLTAPNRALPRSLLAQHFWPGQPLDQGRSNLRQLLHRLKHAWPDSDQYLEASRHTLTWRASLPQRIDLDVLEGLQRAPLTLSSLESILAMLCGPLPGGLDQDSGTPLRQHSALRQTQFLTDALSRAQQEGLSALELGALPRYTEYAPTEQEPFLALLHRVARQQGLAGLRDVFARWKARWERVGEAAPICPLNGGKEAGPSQPGRSYALEATRAHPHPAERPDVAPGGLLRQHRGDPSDAPGSTSLWRAGVSVAAPRAVHARHSCDTSFTPC